MKASARPAHLSRLLSSALAAAALLLCGGAEARTRLLYPLDGSTTVEGGGLVVGFCDDPGVDRVTVELNGVARRVELWGGVFDVDLDWREGANTLAVGGVRIDFRYDPYGDRAAQPVAHQAMLDDCGTCHVLGSSRDLSLTASEPRLCTRCHAAARGRHAAAPCTGCHSPHAAARQGLLLAQGNALCQRCHPAQTAWGASAHGAIAAGPACAACHAPHDPPPRVRAVCETCHGEHLSGVAPHMNVECSACHWMHREGVEARYKEPAGSCADCHTLPAEAGHVSVVAGCTPCHDFHQPTGAPAVNPALCAGCHPSRLGDRHGGDVAAMVQCDQCHPVHTPRDVSRASDTCARCHGADDLRARHPQPVSAQSRCTSCHRLHGAGTPALLAAVQHAPYRGRDCAACHTPTTDRVPTPERTCVGCHGDVARGAGHDPAHAGRCTTCHDPHGGASAAHLRAPIPTLCEPCHRIEAGPRGTLHPATMTCASCHEPHGRGGALRAAEESLCGSCHALAEVPGHPGAAPDAPCSSCHPLHGQARALSGPEEARPEKAAPRPARAGQGPLRR